MRPSIEVRVEDMECLEPGRWLNGTVVEAYLRQIEQRSTQITTLPTVLALDTYFIVDLANYKHHLASRRFKKINPMNVDLILIPLHTTDHWSLIVVRPQMKRVEGYDSLHYPHKGALYQIFHALRRFCMAHDIEFVPSAWHIQNTVTTTPKQTNLIDCGVYMTWFAERISRNAPLENINHSFTPDRWREHVRQTITFQNLTEEDGIIFECTPASQEMSMPQPGASKIIAHGSPPPLPMELVPTVAEEQGPPSEQSPTRIGSWENLVTSVIDCLTPTNATLDLPAATEDFVEYTELHEALSQISVSEGASSSTQFELMVMNQASSPCLSLTCEETLLEEELSDTMQDYQSEDSLPRPIVKTTLDVFADPDSLLTDTESKSQEMTENAYALPPSSSDDYTTTNAIAPEVPIPSRPSGCRPQRYRERRHKIFFPGLGWRKVKDRFIRPDLHG